MCFPSGSIPSQDAGSLFAKVPSYKVQSSKCNKSRPTKTQPNKNQCVPHSEEPWVKDENIFQNWIRRLEASRNQMGFFFFFFPFRLLQPLEPFLGLLSTQKRNLPVLCYRPVWACCWSLCICLTSTFMEEWSTSLVWLGRRAKDVFSCQRSPQFPLLGSSDVVITQRFQFPLVQTHFPTGWTHNSV